MERAAIPSEDSTLTRHQRIADRVLVPGADLPSQSLPTWGRCQCTQHGEELLGRAGNCWAWALRACGVPCCWSRLAAVVAMHISMGREPKFDLELYPSRARGEIFLGALPEHLWCLPQVQSLGKAAGPLEGMCPIDLFQVTLSQATKKIKIQFSL